MILAVQQTKLHYHIVKRNAERSTETVIDYIGSLQTRPLYLLIIVEEVLVEVC